MVAATPRSRTPRTRRSGAQTREHILEVAADLFYWEGIRATGVDTIAARADVAPTTLYRLFASKDDLVAAYVERCSASYRERLTAAASPPNGTPRERILAVFDVFTDEALSESCRGCPFMMVLAEFPDPDHPAHGHAVAHKTWVRSLLHDLVGALARATPLREPGAVADQLALLADGIYGSVQALGAAGPARLGRSCAETLIDAAMVPRGRRSR
jgi:AcrR family transcriptional regulator